MEQFEGRKRGMLTTGERCNPVTNMCKRGPVEVGCERFENVRGFFAVGQFAVRKIVRLGRFFFSYGELSYGEKS